MAIYAITIRGIRSQRQRGELLEHRMNRFVQRQSLLEPLLGNAPTLAVHDLQD
jgi:hypothetical protein